MNIDTFELCRKCIYESPLFEGLSEDELNFLSGHTSNQSYKKGEIIYTQGEEIRYISFLKKGLLKLFNPGESCSDQIISIAKPDDCIGLLSVFSNTHYQYSVAAIEDSDVYYLELSRVKAIVRDNGNFGIKLLGRISKAADAIIFNTYTLNRKNLRGRIAYCLMEFSEGIYRKDVFDLPVSRKEIAELIGMTTENVIRILSEFRRDGIIGMQGKTITILNPELLRAIEKNG